MEPGKRKTLKDAYKEQPAIGGVYCITCSGNRRSWIKATKNIASQQNKYDFALSIGSCPEPAMRSEWRAFGAASFSFTVLETLSQTETQTDAEFGDDLGVLLALWLEKYRQTTMV